MQKAKKSRVPASFVRFLLVPCLISAQAAPVHAKSKKQEGGRSPAVIKNPMDPILSCLSANEVATRRLSNPKWAVLGITGKVPMLFAGAPMSAGLLVQTIEFKSASGATYKKDYAWIPTSEGAAKVDVTGVARGKLGYLKQTLQLESGYQRIGFPFGGIDTYAPPEEKLEEVEVAFTPGGNIAPPQDAKTTFERQVEELDSPNPLLFPNLLRMPFQDRDKSNPVLNAEWKKSDPTTRKVLFDELKKRFEEYSQQAERERLADFSENSELKRRQASLKEREDALELEQDNLSELDQGSETPEATKKEIKKKKAELEQGFERIQQDAKPIIADLLKGKTFEDFLSGLKGCKAALEKDHWNEDEEFAPFYRSVVAELDRLKELQLRARNSQTPSSGKKSGAGNASGAGQAQ